MKVYCGFDNNTPFIIHFALSKLMSVAEELDVSREHRGQLDCCMSLP